MVVELGVLGVEQHHVRPSINLIADESGGVQKLLDIATVID